MTNLVRRIASRGALEEQRSNALAFQQWVDMINYNNVMYPVGYNQTLVGDREDVRGDFTGLIAGAFQANGIVFACMYTRMLHFSQMRFQFRQMRSGKPGALFGTPALQMLETPWPNGTTSDLLARMIQDVDLSGNSYIVRTGDRLARLRPDWVSILLGSQTDRESWVAGDPDTEVIGYIYKPGGLRSGEKEMLFHPERVAHFAPIPDPMANYRGMSWLTPLIREIQADQAMNAHRLKYFEQGATVNLVLRPPPEPQLNQDQFMEWVNIIRSGHEGANKAYRTLYLAAGAEVTPIGSDMQQLDFKVVQGAGEVRIATAARVPATILGISEGLQGSTLNAGNYGSARRNFGDGFLRPTWISACGALASITDVPGGAMLWYDEDSIAFLKEDQKDAADIQAVNAQSIKQLVDAGFESDSVVKAIVANDLSLLQHTGLFSVQLQPAGSTPKQGLLSGTPVPAANGNTNGGSPMVPAQSGA